VNVPHTGMHPTGFTQFPNGAAMKVCVTSLNFVKIISGTLVSGTLVL